ncbi:sensor histidine kinase [Desulforamulus hydrothermalis]|uniref:histidine kinase n=1 Tax=Desulforamulus hydrothermalis Lam5 = DSM 18033 TaxID=1121428 RepID=K8DYX2_9FIRM|nr:HAMP domain-containing sensor histidine kinase [Desulforamulus hydrothermalis]CCO08172.1 ATP-binding region ATPase domain protein [Desulforamulus hydrothermalis Lam5 = DSM 18033]SHH23242.1 two-component system, OmpR family, sensor histidine kinase CssS [Desulforamulus hydrothermalis Lam5 = DSM 18033]
MKNISLTVKIWLAMSLVSLLLYVVVFLWMPIFLHNFFTATLMDPHGPPPQELPRGPLKPPELNIRSFIILADGSTLPAGLPQALPPALWQEIQENATCQPAARQVYESRNTDLPVRYVIRKDMAYGHPLYQVAFLRKSEEDRFMKAFFFNILPYTFIALMISWFASLVLVRYLTRPLVQMQQHVKRIANRNWHEPLVVQQGDEIGKLAASIESMRQQLVQQDEAQQSMLQNISHELKTPVMVIRSYVQAMQDGVFPKGDWAGSMQVIKEESERLEKLVKQLLYLTRLDYLAARNPKEQQVWLNELAAGVARRLMPQRPEINWQLELQPTALAGDPDTLRVMLENLLDNHLRYAVSQVVVKLTGDRADKTIACTIWNDGPHIEPHLLELIQQPFQKGHNGKFGLGLAIVQRIVKLYQGQFSIGNQADGVVSILRFPTSKR